MRILGLSGSLRKGSFNSALLRAAAQSMPEGASLEIGSIAGIPLYDGDVESREGIPDAVVRLKERITACDGLLLSTPEYNNSIPGVFKNAIDWTTRPPADIARIFRGKPVALIGASPGGFGTILSQNAWLPIFHTLGMRHWSGSRLLVSRATNVFDEAGELVDADLRERLRSFVMGFVTFVGAQHDA